MKKLFTLVLITILLTIATTADARTYQPKQKQNQPKIVSSVMTIKSVFYDFYVKEFEFMAIDKNKAGFVVSLVKCSRYNKKLENRLKKIFINQKIVLKYNTMGTKNIYDDVIIDWKFLE